MQKANKKKTEKERQQDRCLHLHTEMRYSHDHMTGGLPYCIGCDKQVFIIEKD